jgi:DNA-directed RNA polymerase specialized sigma24 family protein
VAGLFVNQGLTNPKPSSRELAHGQGGHSTLRQRSPATLATEKLVTRLQHGKDLNGDMALLVENLGKLITSRLRHHQVRAGDWRDLHQSCWLEVWRLLAKWDPKQSAISSYIYAAVDSVWSKQHRKYCHRIERENDCGVLQEVTGKRMM